MSVQARPSGGRGVRGPVSISSHSGGLRGSISGPSGGSEASILEPTTEMGRLAALRNRADTGNRVQVAVRVRPMTRADGNVSENAVHVTSMNTLKISKGQGEPAKDFNYDYVFSGGQDEVFDCIGKPMLADAYEGYNVTLFAYGQTGSGKTHSITGPTDDPGVVPQFCKAMLSIAQEKLETDPTLTVKVGMSLVEIYNEKVRDLLEKKQPGQTELTELGIHETKDHKVFVDGVSIHQIMNLERIQSLLQIGMSQRQVSETNMNETSSRSHSVVMFYLSQTHDPPHPESRDIESTINIVDLAGSERQSKTGATGERFEEAKKINLSLLMLGRALNSFSEGKGPPPLRESKLTRLLSESFGGNARTWMLACVSPSLYNYTETISTLQYAQNAKNIINHAKINALQQKLELQQLKKQYALLQEYFEKQKAETKELQSQLSAKAKLVEKLNDDLESLKDQLEGRPSTAPKRRGATPFVGRAKLSLKNIIQQVRCSHALPLITDNPAYDGVVLMVNTLPVVDESKRCDTYDDVEEGLKALMGKRLDLVVHVKSATNIPQQFSSRVYCKYVFKYKERQVFQSEDRFNTTDPEFDYKKRFAWSDLTREQAEYLMSDNVLTFEVIGHPANEQSESS